MVFGVLTNSWAVPATSKASSSVNSLAVPNSPGKLELPCFADEEAFAQKRKVTLFQVSQLLAGRAALCCSFHTILLPWDMGDRVWEEALALAAASPLTSQVSVHLSV